ncbi:uncharacterized protein [Physcomitrium patens]|uniref:Uncharacterized protein n=1 Tax=Physcomitrium patens TaxID=3218 RepID=A0A7I4FAC0_PHYPA|nr:uncharacterized protein LOC112272791 isoform X2 [Physcomitrium patens]|eukprot:XP_024356674.1 uncharacterized protein LOC112272791 isoform X2 [Physcomitrella patens]
MSKDSLFGGLPPPVTSQPLPPRSATGAGRGEAASSIPSILSSSAASKRSVADDDSHGKRVRFKPTTTEATSEQVLEAMAKIASHIGNPGKFPKASKLALQLLESGSVTPATADAFFSILKAAMARPSNAVEASLRRDYQALFVAVHDRLECFTGAQQAQISVWEFWALVGNDFVMDDTFVFSKASGRVRQAIDELPEATDEANIVEEREEKTKDEPIEQGQSEKAVEDAAESDPFGLNAFLPKRSKKEERLKRKLEEEAASKRAQEEAGKLLRERREALLQCLKIAAEYYRLTWAQTIIDILVRHAFDNRAKFSAVHQGAIEKLWASVRDQQVRRKQGKSTTGKLDVTSFERFQEQYSRETISIRRAVGHGGGRSAEQWLG